MAVELLELNPQAKPRRDDIEPVLVDATGAARMLGLSVSMFHRLLSSGRIGPQKISFGQKCCRYSVEELRMWIANGAVSRREWLEMKARKL